MKAELVYVTDVYCLWCYGFSETLNRIAAEYADRAELRVVNGGMIPEDMSLEAFFGRFPDPIGLHQHVTDMSGQKFGTPYLDQISNLSVSTRTLNSFNPARAMAALIMLGVEDTLKLASELKLAHYNRGLDLSDPESYRNLDSMKSVDFDTFQKLFADRSTFTAAAEGFQWASEVGIEGFPALLLKHTDTQYLMLAHGFMPYQALKQGLDHSLKSMFGVGEGTGLSCRLDGTDCT